MKFSVIRPVNQWETYLGATLESSFHLASCDYEVIFCMENAELRAEALVERLCREHPEIRTTIVHVDKTCTLKNPKLRNLERGWEAATGKWIIMADCNALLTTDTIYRFLSLWNPSVGLACSPPCGSDPGNFWAEVECSFLNTYQAKWQLLAGAVGWGFAMGKVLFCRKEQFEKIGGIAALDSEPAEDAAATKMVRAAGLQVKVVQQLFKQPLGHRSFRTMLDRQVRWARLRRATFPHLFALESLTTLVPSLLLVWFFPRESLVFLALGYVLEMALAGVKGWHLSLQTLPAMLVRDLLLGWVWAAGWFSDHVIWDGQTVALEPSGTMVRIRSTGGGRR